MVTKKPIENIERRIIEGEFNYLQKKYPTVAFNIYDWWGGMNDRTKGKNILFATEGYITIPNNYNPNFIKKYDAFITYNQKFKELHPELNIYVTGFPPYWDNFFELETFLSYDEKIKSVCSLQRVYHTGIEGDINYMKDKVMKELNVEPHLSLHTYGPSPFGKPGSYKGKTPNPTTYEALKLINKYMFCWCPEPMYHPLWSHNLVTERLFNCFKSKTIPIYYGCYNVEDIIPLDLFIDYRKFESNQHLSQYLIELSQDKRKYIEMTESAYEWNLTNKIGDIELMESIISFCINKYPF